MLHFAFQKTGFTYRVYTNVFSRIGSGERTAFRSSYLFEFISATFARVLRETIAIFLRTYIRGSNNEFIRALDCKLLNYNRCIYLSVMI
jgi:hypothetical protein